MKRNRLPLVRANVAILVSVILGIVVLLNYLSYKHHKRFDTTAVGKYSLSDQTLKILKSLSDELKITMFDKSGTEQRAKAKELLTEYQYYSDHINAQYIDPDQRPAMATQYGISRYGTLVLEFQGQQQQVDDITEEKLTNAILKVTKGESRLICFLDGHAEADIGDDTKTGYSLLGQALAGQNYTAKKLLLMRESKIPADCSLLVVAGPKTGLMNEELAAIEDYLSAGGKTFFLLDPPMKDGSKTGLAELLANWGVSVGNDIVIDPMSQLFAGDYFMPVITGYPEHPITHDFKLASFFPLSRSISPKQKTPENITIQSLASTSGQNSWAESQINGPYEYSKGEDKLGPVSVAVAAEIKPKHKAVEDKAAKESGEAEAAEDEAAPVGRLVVFGDSDFVNNTYLNLSGNRDLFLNVVSWLVQEEELISIRPKSDVPRTISLTSGQMQAVFYLSVILLPVLCMAAGLSVWLRRRRL